jgi:hypothetical protein
MRLEIQSTKAMFGIERGWLLGLVARPIVHVLGTTAWVSMAELTLEEQVRERLWERSRFVFAFRISYDCYDYLDREQADA